MTAPPDDTDSGLSAEAGEDSAPEALAPAPATSPSGRVRPRIVALASGRGGTGQSLLAANVAVYLAQAAK